MYTHNVTTNKRGDKMFVIVATKPLNDGTSGFRFNVLGQKGLVRKRKRKVRATGKQVGPTMDVFSIGKFSLALEKKRPARKLAHFAG